MTEGINISIVLRVGALLAAAALAFTAFVALDSAEAGDFNERISGNFIDTGIDTDGDGMQANSWSGAANGSGSPSYEGLVEVKFGITGLCGSDEFEGTVVEYSIVRRYSNGDLVFSRLIDGNLCFNPTTGLASLVINAEVTGGTGHHADATGTYTADFTVQGLVADLDQAIVHGAFYGTTSG